MDGAIRAIDAITGEATLFAAVGLLIGGIDDVIVDILFIVRRLFGRTPTSAVPPRADAPHRFAIFVPAWDESAVIGQMLASAVTRLDHPDYRLFVGLYPNDRPTIDAAARVAETDPRIILVIGQNDIMEQTHHRRLQTPSRICYAVIMEDDGFIQTVHGLLRKRAALVSEIEHHRAQIEQRFAALDHVDATIRVFKPDIDAGDMPERPAPPPSAAFRGEVQRFLLSVLRRADGPMPTRALALAVMDARRLDVSDRVLAKLIRVRTGHSLRSMANKGFIVGTKYGSGAELEWVATARQGEVTGGWRNGTTSKIEREK